MKLFVATLCLFVLFMQNTWAACGGYDEACLHNEIRDALSSGQTVNNLGPSLNQMYDFSLQNRPANRLPLFTNSASLRSSAASHAALCEFQHSGINDIGENLFVGTGPSWNMINAINAWADEARYLTYPKDAATVSCQTGKQCGHYTQMIWETTSNVGCAVQFCATGISGFSGGPSTIFVCHYSPPGNFVAYIGGPILAPYVGLGVIGNRSPVPSIPSILLLLLLTD